MAIRQSMQGVEENRSVQTDVETALVPCQIWIQALGFSLTSLPMRVFVKGDSVQPSTQRRVPFEGTGLSPCGQKGLLGQVLRIFDSPRQVAHKAQDRGVLLMHERFHRGWVSVGDPLCGFEIVHCLVGLGSKFEQNGFVWTGADAVPQLILMR